MKKQHCKVKINDLYRAHPQVRAKDWCSPLVRRLLTGAKYKDGAREIIESYRSQRSSTPKEETLCLTWDDLKGDFDQAVKSYQDPVITEFATLGLACILLTERAGLEITEVTRRGEKADYWLGDKRFLLEVSGQQSGTLEGLCSEKAAQLLENPFDKPGYVCVAIYDEPKARLWFFGQRDKD
jgi:hypothetical protein